jgi:hypothetical protein
VLTSYSQNGRVSPRKSSLHSDQGSTSPVHAVNKDGEQSSAEPPTTGSTPTLPNLKKSESQNSFESWRGLMPPKIEEADEPPHPTVLPT